MTATERNTRVSMIEDNEVILRNVSKFLSLHEEFEVLDLFYSVEDFIHKMKVQPSFEVDVILLDIGLKGMSGIQGIPQIKAHLPKVEIIMLTTYEEEDMILRAICAGATSYLSKKASLKEIVECIRVVVKGGSYMSPSIAREIFTHIMGGRKTKTSILTSRQEEVLQALVEGKTYRAIADELYISIDTVKGHIKKLYQVLQVNNKAEAIAMYLRGEIR